MENNSHGKILRVAIHTVVITLLAVVLSNTLIYSFTSIVALKSSIEVKDYQISDLYSAVSDRNPIRTLSDDVILVAVDALSREQITDVIQVVNSASPRAVGVDILFEYPHVEDSALISVTSAANMVMAAVRYDDTTMLTSYFCDDMEASRVGITNLEVSSPIDVVRCFRTQYMVWGIPYNSFASKVATVGGYEAASAVRDGSYIYFPGLEFRVVEPWMLAEQPERCDSLLKDKIVLIGDMENMQDMHRTPVGTMSGLQIQASIIETIVKGHDIQRTSVWVDWAVAILSCVLLVLVNMFLSGKNLATGKLLLRLAQILLLYLYFWAGCELFARYGLSVDFAPALSMIALGLLAYDIYFGCLVLYKKLIIKQKSGRT